MNEIIYLELDEDITGVIAKAKETDAKSLTLVIPRGGSIAQSVVNLKLMKREIEKLEKTVSLVTKDKISKNLASQVGVTVYPTVAEAKNSRPSEQSQERQDKFSNKPDGFSTSGFKINQYSRDIPEKETTEQQETDGNVETETRGAIGLTQMPHAEEISEPTMGNEGTAKPEVDSEEARVAEERHQMAHAEPVIRRKEDTSEGKEAPETPKHNVSSRRKPVMIILIVLLLILLAGGTVLYPSATVNLTLATEDLEKSEDIILDKAATASNLETLTMPLREYNIEKSAERDYPATGSKDIGQKASGEITFYNDYIPPNVVTIPPITLADGTVLSAAGQTFILDGSITIPAPTFQSYVPLKTTPGQVKGRVTAKNSGESSNIAPSKFVISSFSGTKQEKIYGQSTAALNGGTSQILKVVTDDDINKAKTAQREELSNTAKEELTKNAEADSTKLIVSSINVSDLEFQTNKKAGDESDNFKSTLRIRVTELAYSEVELKRLALNKVKAALQNDEMLVNSDENNITYDLIKIDQEKGTVSIKSSFKGKQGKKIEANSIKQTLVKSKYGNAESKLEAMDGIKDAAVTIKPNFWPLLPFLSQRINVNFDYQKD